MKTSDKDTTATGTITVHRANTADEALGMLRSLAEAAKNAPISERMDWDCEPDGYGTASLDGEEVARIVPALHEDGAQYSSYWFVTLNGVAAEGDCTDADDGYRKVVRMLEFLEGWSAPVFALGPDPSDADFRWERESDAWVHLVDSDEANVGTVSRDDDGTYSWCVSLDGELPRFYAEGYRCGSETEAIRCAEMSVGVYWGMRA